MSVREGHLLSREEQNLQVQIATACAEDGDPWAMLAHLQRANVLTGVKITFRRKWPGLPEEDVDDMLGKGVDALFQKLSGGAHVGNPIGYMLEVMRRQAYDYLVSQRETVRLDPERDQAPEPGVREVWDGRRTEAALRVSRSLLSRLGQQSIQVVMTQIFDAIESGREQITAAEIARAAGLTEDTVRQCRSRGFRRLERIVREEGLARDDALDVEARTEIDAADTAPRTEDYRIS